MSDKTKNELPAETESIVDKVIDAATDVVSDQTIPAPIRKGFWAAFKIHRTRNRYGRLIESIETEWKPICERVECSNDAKDVHHWNYDRVGKEQIGMDPEASEENDLIALCRQCHTALHAEGKITG